MHGEAFKSLAKIPAERPAILYNKSADKGVLFFIDRHLALIFYYFFLYTVFVCKFRPKESQSDVLGDLRRIISLVVGPYFDMPPLLLPGLEPATLERRLC